MSEHEGTLVGRIEAILFVAGDAVDIRDLARALDLKEKELSDFLDEMEKAYEAEGRGLMIKRFGSMVQLATRPLYAQDVVRLLQPVQRQSLGQASMETLAVIAYRQPVTRAEIEAIRGVPPDNMIRTLVERQLIHEVGRKDAPGRPTQFGTTKEFLKFFGLNSIADLPQLDEKESERFELAR